MEVIGRDRITEADEVKVNESSLAQQELAVTSTSLAAETSPVTEDERRIHYRIQTSCRVQIHFYHRAAGQGRFSYTDVHKTALVEDISASGVLLWIAEPLELGTTFEMAFPVMGKGNRLDAKVVREAGEREGLNCYGCSFVNPTPGQVEALRDELVRLQLLGRGERK